MPLSDEIASDVYEANATRRSKSRSRSRSRSRSKSRPRKSRTRKSRPRKSRTRKPAAGQSGRGKSPYNMFVKKFFAAHPLRSHTQAAVQDRMRAAAASWRNR